MVKKCLIAIAVVALLATTVQAIEQPDGFIKLDPQTDPGGWPWTQTITFDTFNICTIDVKLEVGHFVQIEDCGDIDALKLQQVDCSVIGKDGDDFPCYEGCRSFRARANFPAFFGATFDGSQGDLDSDIIGGNHSLDWDSTDDNEILGDGEWEDLKICMTAWKVKLWASGTTSGSVKVGQITITVKPGDVVTTGP